MAILGKTELKADKDVAAGTEISLFDLFPFSERSKQFVAEEDVVRDQTKLTVNVAKFGTLEVISDAMLKKGFNTSLATLLKWADSNKRVKVSESIRKDETLAVTVEC